MLSSSEYIDNLREELIKVGVNDEYLQACIKYAERLSYRGLPVIFDTKHLSLLLGLFTSELCNYITMPEKSFYQKMLIPKKHGGSRELSIPCKNLKQIQRWILDNILCTMSISNHAMGFCHKRSIVTNAEEHVCSEYVLNLDLRNFFPSINYDRVFYVFKYFGYTKEISYVLARLCTYKKSLPQGAPTSPALSNIICLKLDKRLSKLAEKNGAKYTRYADDITFSGKHCIFGLLETIKMIILAEGFEINNEKTRFRSPGQRLEITGLNISNGLVKVPREYVRKYKTEIYFCKKYGPTDHQKRKADTHMFFKEHMYGKAYFIKMVEPELGSKFLSELDNITWEY